MERDRQQRSVDALTKLARAHRPPPAADDERSEEGSETEERTETGAGGDVADTSSLEDVPPPLESTGGGAPARPPKATAGEDMISLSAPKSGLFELDDSEDELSDVEGETEGESTATFLTEVKSTPLQERPSKKPLIEEMPMLSAGDLSRKGPLIQEMDSTDEEDIQEDISGTSKGQWHSLPQAPKIQMLD